MALGKSPDSPTALMALATYEVVGPDVVEALEAAAGILGVAVITEA